MHFERLLYKHLMRASVMKFNFYIVNNTFLHIISFAKKKKHQIQLSPMHKKLTINKKNHANDTEQGHCRHLTILAKKLILTFLHLIEWQIRTTKSFHIWNFLHSCNIQMNHSVSQGFIYVYRYSKTLSFSFVLRMLRERCQLFKALTSTTDTTMAYE